MTGCRQDRAGESTTSLDARMLAARVPTGQLVLFWAMLGGLLVLLVAAYAIRARSGQRRHRKHVAWLFSPAVREAGLTLPEYDLLQNMAAALPKGATEKHRLVTDRGTFDRALRAVPAEDEAPNDLVESLLGKLGLVSAGGDRGQSTRNLRAGLEFTLLQETGQTCVGEIRQVHALSLVVALEPGSVAPGAGDDVVVHYRVPAGRYSFATRVRRSHARAVELAHRDEVMRVQERRTYRGGVDAPVVVAVPRRAGFATRLIDLSAGGAAIRACPEAEGLRPGQRLALTLDLPTKEHQLTVTARLIRRSGESLGLKFDPISDRTQDRIMRFVLSKDAATHAS